MRKALLGQWQATGYLLVLAGCMLYSALTAPYWSISFVLTAGLVLLAPLGLCQWSLSRGRILQGYFFAVTGAIMYSLLCIVGTSVLFQAIESRIVLSPLGTVLAISQTALAAAAAMTAGGAALELRSFCDPRKNMPYLSGGDRSLHDRVRRALH